MRFPAFAVLILASAAAAQTAPASNDLKYQLPPDVLVKLVDAPPTPTVLLSPEHSIAARQLLIRKSASLPTIAELAEPELRLAGLRFNPETNAPSRTRTFTSLELQALPSPGDSSPRPSVSVTGLPTPLHALYTEWSPDGRHIAVVNEEKDGLSLWIVTAATHSAQHIPGVKLNAVLTQPIEWIDSNSLALLTVPAHRVTPPKKSEIPTGPVVQENYGRATPAPTYEDLLKSPTDEALFEYNAASQLAVLKLGSAPKPLGQPSLFVNIEASPDGKYLLTEALHRPFSYTQPYMRFPQKREVIEIATAKAKTLDDAPLIDNLPIDRDATQPGPRGYGWRSDKPATVYWVQAADGGDAKKQSAVRDRIYTLDAPFTGEGKSILDLALRYGGVLWGNEHLAIVNERRWKDRKVIMLAVDPATGTSTTLYEGKSEDRYHDPGRPVTTTNANGARVLQTTADGQGVYVTGAGASPKGDAPFVAILPLHEGAAAEKRIWQSAAPFYEVPTALLPTADGVEVLARRESVEQSPNYFLTNPLSASTTASATWTPVTSFPSPYTGLKMPTHQKLFYKRADGLDLTADLYLPAGYDKSQGPLPTLMEAYPAEFKSRSAASQVSGTPYEFVRITSGSPVFFAMTGYAVLANAAIPIIGEGSAEPNDTYVEQLVDGAKAAVDAGAATGAVDRNRVAVMGHSYGAFMTANLAAHTNLFRAGIARSGAYNRSLTPFGFQNEERTYWQAPEVYYKMSPFSYADKIKTPLLLIHGEADNNTGTFPIQSERFYNALKGHGATVRFVLLPLEAHGYQGRESVLHMLWEMQSWLDKYVKPEKPVVSSTASAAR